MAEESHQSPKPDLSLRITVSSDTAFLPTLEALVAHVGEFAGCLPKDARDLGRAVVRALDAAWHARDRECSTDRFDLDFHKNTRLVRVDLLSPSGLADGPVFERALSGGVGEELRLLVDRLECDDADGQSRCRLTRQIREGR